MEIYKDIEGYFGKYKISNYGNITSNGKTLKQEIVKKSHTNYKRISLSKNGKVSRYQVHRLVAEYFIENSNNYNIVNHIDNNGENNYYGNLEWTTHSGNMSHSSNQGRQDSVRKKGGDAAGKIKKEQQYLKLNSILNKNFGDIVVLKIISYGRKPRILVKCNLCNTEYETHTGNVYKNKETSCQKCALIKNAQKLVNNNINLIENTIVNNRRINDVVFFKNKYKGLVTCLDCNRSKFMYLHPVLRKKNPTLCICNKTIK